MRGEEYTERSRGEGSATPMRLEPPAPRRTDLDGAEEELRAVGARAGVGHREDACTCRRATSGRNRVSDRVHSVCIVRVYFASPLVIVVIMLYRQERPLPRARGVLLLKTTDGGAPPPVCLRVKFSSANLSARRFLARDRKGEPNGRHRRR
eukprot:SAG11_NODE_2558_length_3220_cov_11.157001_2_plen_151_part_00